MGDLDDRLERTILGLLAERRPGATICPSDAARAVGSADGWRDLMDPARAAARRLVAEGRVEVTQGGRVVDLDTATGAIRIRLSRGFSPDLGPSPGPDRPRGRRTRRG